MTSTFCGQDILDIQDRISYSLTIPKGMSY